VVDCTGSPAGFAVARAAVRPRGTLVLKSTYVGDLAIDASGLVVDEIRVVGSRCGPFPTALESLAAGRIRVDDLVDAVYPLARVREAFDHAERTGALKVLLEP
jgi:threonine dehydrogenase-like Zn-dependent dehydrogenase